MKDPAFLFYSSDFLTGCTSLTMDERGQFITLLCVQHQTGHLSDKTIRLSVGNVSDDVLRKFVVDENGLLYNIRLDEEIEKRAQFVESRRVNGLKGGRPSKPLGLPNDYPSDKPNGKPKNNLVEDENVNEIISEISSLFKSEYIKDSTKAMLSKLLKKYSKEEILLAIKWAKSDSFWNSNFLSPAKLDSSNNEKVKYIDIFLEKAKSESSNNRNKTLSNGTSKQYHGNSKSIHPNDPIFCGLQKRSDNE